MITETLNNLLHQTAFFNLDWGNYVMIAVACFFLYLAIKHEFEPLLLVPIAFGMLLVNIYPDIMAEPYTDVQGLEHAGGLFYYFFTLESDDSTQYVVIDKSLRPVNRYTTKQVTPEPAFDFSAYLFPVRITQSAYTGIKVRIGDPAKFLFVNLLLALLTFCIRRRQKYSVEVLLIDTLIVALLGIYGMAGAFAIPYRRNDKKEKHSI